MLKLSVSRVSYPRAKPVSISFHTWDIRQGLVLVLAYRDLLGLGEANPFKPITGDSEEELIEDARKIESLPLDPEKEGPEALHAFLDSRISCASLRSALDSAYHDLIGQIRGVPIHRLYRSEPRWVDNSVTVFIQGSAEESAREAREIYHAFPHLRILKIKLQGSGDIERARAIRDVSPPGVRFVLDANQGYSEATRAVDALGRIGEILGDVILVEEPCPKDDLDSLKYVKEHVSGMLVFADESAPTVEKAKRVLDAEAAHGVNIKLQKAGGIWPARQIAELCRQRGASAMVGAMIEGPISICAGIHFAVSIDNALFSDLDTDLDLPVFTKNQPAFESGRRILCGAPGLGAVPDAQAMEGLGKGRLAVETILGDEW